MTNMLANNPLDDSLRPFAKSIFALPAGESASAVRTAHCLRLHGCNRGKPAASLLMAVPAQQSIWAACRWLAHGQLASLILPACRRAVQPGTAHVLAGYYGSLGGLMDMLLDPSR